MPGMAKTMSEWKHGNLHSGSKKGPKVTSQKQAIAIGLNQARKRGGKDAPSTDTSTPSLKGLSRDAF